MRPFWYVFRLAALCAVPMASFAAESCSEAARALQTGAWAFQLTAADFQGAGMASIGLLQAKALGVVEVRETFDNNFLGGDSIQATGSYALDADCTGGRFRFSRTFAGLGGGTYPVEIAFRFAKARTELMLAATSPLLYPLAGLQSGVARRAPNGCRPGTTGTAALAPGNWMFRTAAPYFPSIGASVGLLRPYVENGATLAAGTETMVAVNATQRVPFRTALIANRYEISPDCTGGELALAYRAVSSTQTSTEALHMAFVFASPDANSLFLVNGGRAAAGPASIASTAAAGMASRNMGACPANAGDLLTKSPWAFQLLPAEFQLAGAVSIGTFRALAGGVLEVSEIRDGGGRLTRDSQGFGTWEVDGDCSGGRLEFTANARTARVEFVFAESNTALQLLSYTLNRGVVRAETGQARRTVVDCASVAPQGDWTFRLAAAYYQGQGIATVGRWSIANNLAVKSAETSGVASAGLQNETASGSVTLDESCGSGRIQTDSATAGEVDFVFAGANRTEMFVLGRGIAGQAAR